jgi:glutaredoxin
MLPLLLAVLLGSPALDQARKELANGKVDAVLFALQPASAVPKEEAKDAAAVLVEAAKLANARSDKPMALLLAQTGLKKDASCGPALELLGAWSLRDSELNLAIDYGKQWVKAEPQSEHARSFLARAEEAERSWTPPEHRKRRSRRPRIAHAELEPKPLRREPAVSSARVTLYGTAWCPACAKARKWLADKRVAFENVDIEKDERGARDLQQKKLRFRMHGSTIPVIDVNGRLLQGFSARALAAALERP